MSSQRNANRKPKSSRARKRRLARKQANKLNFETLEARHLLASLTVSNATDLTNADTSSIAALIANDGGDGISLREAVIASNNTTGEDTISFDGSVFTGGANSLIRLTQGELEITESLSIDGSAATEVTITGDANGDDVTVAGTFITDVAASFGETAGDADDLLDDNSRVLRFISGFGFTGDPNTVTLIGLTLTGGRTTGSGDDGGAIVAATGGISLINSTVSGNSTSGILSDGGGIYTISGDISSVNSTLSGNVGARGGGIGTRSGDISLTDSSLSDNSAIGRSFSSRGGGIDAGRGSVSLINSTLSGNTTTGDGGGIYTREGDVSLLNSTLFGNAAATGAGGGISAYSISDFSSITIKNSIVAGNIDNGTATDLRSDSNNTLAVEHSLIGDTTGTEIDSSTGTGNILNRPALLGPLSDNGGPTLTHALLEGSPAINGGSNALAIDSAGTPLNTDQRGSGFDRIQFSSVDIGAFESDFDSLLPPVVVSATVNEGGVLARPDLLNTLTIVFDRDVTVDAASLTLFNDAPRGAAVDLSGIDFSYDASTSTAVWDFTSIDPLDAGFYTFRLDTNSISSGNITLDGNGDGIRGDAFVVEHYVAIPGDANLDGTVDVVNDAFTLVSNLNSSADVSFADGDFNGDGRVDVLGDAFILVANLNRNVQLVTDVAVSNTTDLLNGDIQSIFDLIANDGGDGISLREAIIASNNTLGLGTITFDESVFTGGTDSLIRLTQGELEITETLTIDGSSATDVTITGDANGDDIRVAGSLTTNVDASVDGSAGDRLDDNSRVLNFSNRTGNLTIAGLTLTGGRTTGDNPNSPSQPNETTYSGGGVRFLSTGELSIVNSTLSGNSTSGIGASGGGVYSFFGNVTLANSTISGNRTSGVSAGGGGIASVSGNVSLNTSTITDNSTVGNDSTGGGIAIVPDDGDELPGNGSSSNVSLVNSTVIGNSTSGDNAVGGGIRAGGGTVSLINSAVRENSTSGDDARGGGISTGSGDISLTNSTLSENSTTGMNADGGGIQTGSGNISLANSVINENSTNGNDASGGGIYASGISSFFTGDISITNSTLSGNSTNGDFSAGGGIAIVGGSVSLTNSTLSGNSTSGMFSATGGIYSSSANISLVNSTLTQNSASNSAVGGISVGGSVLFGTLSVTIENSIVADNSDSGVASDIFIPGNLDSNLLLENSLIGNTTGSGITASTGTGNILDQSALLGPLADNGGPTLTHALLPGSPAINGGNNALAVDVEGNPLATDQRGDGFDRIQLGTVDIGAFESDFASVAAATSDSAQLTLAGDHDLRDDVFGSDF